MSTAEPRTRDAAFVRLAGYYVASFAVLGIYMQFFPRWLAERRGCTPEAAALVLSGQIWARTLAGPLWAQQADRSGRPRRVLLVLSLASLAAAAAFAVTHGQAWLFVACVAFGCVYPPIHPILDSLALATSVRAGFTFSAVRLCGSLSFLVAIVAMGAYLRAGSAEPARYEAILGCLLVGLVAVALAGCWLPDVRGAAHAGAPVRELLGNRRFVLFLAAAGLIQGSHAAYYSLSTNDWHRHGIDELTAGALWAEGILAEIVFFWVARTRLGHLRPTTLMLAGGAAAVVRWLGLGLTHDVLALIAVNWLHAASFACTFLGAVQFVQKRVPEHQRATGQGLLGATSSGACTALATMLAAFVYRHAGSGAYFAMAGLAGAGTLLAFLVRRRPETLR